MLPTISRRHSTGLSACTCERPSQAACSITTENCPSATSSGTRSTADALLRSCGISLVCGRAIIRQQNTMRVVLLIWAPVLIAIAGACASATACAMCRCSPVPLVPSGRPAAAAETPLDAVARLTGATVAVNSINSMPELAAYLNNPKVVCTGFLPTNDVSTGGARLPTVAACVAQSACVCWGRGVARSCQRLAAALPATAARSAQQCSAAPVAAAMTATMPTTPCPQQHVELCDLGACLLCTSASCIACMCAHQGIACQLCQQHSGPFSMCQGVAAAAGFVLSTGKPSHIYLSVRV